MFSAGALFTIWPAHTRRCWPVPIPALQLFKGSNPCRGYTYCVVQACLSWWSVVSPFSGYGSTAALAFVLIVAAIKATFEDKKRHQEDHRTNKSIAHVVQTDGQLVRLHHHKAYTDPVSIPLP